MTRDARGPAEDAPAERDGAGGIASSVAQRAWSIAAAVGVVAGGVLLLAGHADWAFVAAALGVVAWFLNMRGQLQRQNVERDAARAGDSEEDVDAS